MKKTAEDFKKELQEKAKGSYLKPTVIPPVYYEEWDKTTTSLRAYFRRARNADAPRYKRCSSSSLIYLS